MEILMINITKIGENARHDSTFTVDRPSGHPAWLLLLIKSPSKFYIDSKYSCYQQSNNYTYNQMNDIPKDCAVIFKPYQKHLYGAQKDIPYTDNWIHIDENSLIMPENFPFGIPVLLHNTDDFYNLFHLINSEFYGNTPHKNSIISSLTDALIKKIIDECNTAEFPDIYYNLAILRENIYSCPENDWTIDNMTESLNISKGYLHYIYRHFFNTTCISDVINSRIQSACELLSSTNKSIEEIGFLCGYKNTEHFIRQFKKSQNITPAKYRKAFAKNNSLQT